MLLIQTKKNNLVNPIPTGIIPGENFKHFLIATMQAFQKKGIHSLCLLYVKRSWGCHQTVCLFDEDTDFFDIVACVLQGDTLTSYSVHILPLLRILNVNRFNKRKCFFTKKADDSPHKLLQTHRLHRRHSCFLANTPTQAESLLHRLEQACQFGQNGVHVF